MGIENPQNQKSDSVVEKKETAKEALHVYLGTLGFYAETNYSGNEYAKWVSQDGELVIGSLPDLDDMPNLGEVGPHHSNGRNWKPISLGNFARLD